MYVANICSVCLEYTILWMNITEEQQTKRGYLISSDCSGYEAYSHWDENLSISLKLVWASLLISDKDFTKCIQVLFRSNNIQNVERKCEGASNKSKKLQIRTK